MKRSTEKNFMSDEKKRFILRTILLSAPIIAFFIVAIVSYYDLLYTNARDDIISDGQAASTHSVDYIHDHISKSEDAVKLIAYTTERMINENRSNNEILEYFKRQSTAVSNAVFEDMTGIHGYIRGEFLDAITWTPDPNFVVTKRPWYTEAIKNGENVAVTSPHLDFRTGNAVIAISKGLSDEKSVIAINVNLDTVQKYIEQNLTSGRVDCEFILDAHNKVVVHSDKNEIGKDYTNETDSFVGLLLSKAKNTDKNFFELDYNGEHYVVYSAKMDDNWHYLSVKNATDIFSPLKRFLAIAILITIVIIFWLSYMMNKGHQKYIVSQKINEELSSISNIYLVVYDFDIINDTFRKIKSGTFEYDGFSKNENQSASSLLKNFISQKVDSGFINYMLYFVDFNTLNERLKNTETVEMEYQNKKGEWRSVRFIATQRLRNNTVTQVLWLIEDINSEKTETNFNDQSFVESEEARYTFMTNVSDEIRTPLNTIIGMNDMILRECESQEIITYSENIKTAGQTLLDLANNIVDFSKIETGRIEIVPVDYDLSSIVNDLVNMVQVKTDSKGLSLDLDFNRNTPKMLHGDEIRIKQIITNMLNDAVKYTEKGGVTFSVGFKEIDDDPNSVMILVSVQDTGVGMKVSEIKKMLAGFKRIKETRIRNIDNISLDKTITQNLLYLMGSTLQVESVYGFGAKFSFELKQSVVEWIPLGDYDESYKKIIKTNKKHKTKFTAPEAEILVVDDNLTNLLIFKNMLSFTKVNIDIAESGDEGLLMTQNKKYDIIFLDHMMPKKNGVATLHELRTQELRTQVKNPNLYTIVVCLTANTVSGARELYLGEGFDDYLSKPIELEKLEAMLMTYLPKEKIKLEDV